tara:strand:- start:297 stop:596 length:300 start_codon:yes stop_codon:yes gene_type:complete
MREEIRRERNKKKVLKQYPNAFAEQNSNGIRIMSGDIFIAEEYFMPETSCEHTAWEYAAMSCKLTQNFNRTHPDRMDLSQIEGKLNRINKRKRRGRRVK